MLRSNLRLTLALTLAAALAGCEQVKGTFDRAAANLSLKSACPDAVEGRAAGADSADGALQCFQHAAKEGSADLLLRISCGSRAPASCKQTASSKAAAEQLAPDLKKQDWSRRLGTWPEGKEGKVTHFSLDTSPGEKKVSVVTVCRIIEGDRWAVCGLDEMGREQAEQKAK